MECTEVADHACPCEVSIHQVDCSLDVQLHEGERCCCYTLESLTDNYLHLLRKDARSTHGLTTGSMIFEMEIIRNKPVPEMQHPHSARIGFSDASCSRKSLGERPGSYGYGSTGKRSENGIFESFAVPYQVGDTVAAAILFLPTRLELTFFKNGQRVGYFSVNRVQSDTVMLPHVNIKNVDVEVRFCSAGSKYTEHYPPEIPFLGDLLSHQLVPNPILRVATYAHASVTMMIGAPGTGKSHCVSEVIMKEIPGVEVLSINDL